VDIVNNDIHARGPQRWALQADRPAGAIRVDANRLWTYDGPVNGNGPNDPPTHHHIKDTAFVETSDNQYLGAGGVQRR
jgi:hypothetical protein